MTSTMTSQLVNLKDIGTTLSWDFPLPTLTAKGRFSKRRPMNNESFCKAFYEKYPNLQKLNWSNIVVKGGAVVDLLMENEPNDLDFFMYGLDGDEAFVKRASEFLNDLLIIEREYAQEKYDKAKEEHRQGRYGVNLMPIPIDIKAVRLKNVITIRLSAVVCKVQLVLNSCSSLDEVVNSADIACCGTFFDGKEVWTSEEGKFELENVAIRISSDKLPTQRRISKYYTKGFDFVLPQLNIDKLPRNYLKLGLKDAIQTDSLGFAYDGIEGNRIHVSHFIESKVEKVIEKRSYWNWNDPNDIQFDGRDILYQNLSQIATGGSNFLVYAEQDMVGDALHLSPELTPRQFDQVYLALEQAILSDTSFAFGDYEKYVKVVPLADALNSVFDPAVKDRSAVLGDILNKQKQESIEKWQTMRQDREKTVKLVTNWKQTFLTSTEFYGDYLKA